MEGEQASGFSSIEDFKLLSAKLAEYDMKLWQLQNVIIDVLNDPQPAKQALLYSVMSDSLTTWAEVLDIHSRAMNNVRQEKLLNAVEIEGIPEAYGKSIEELALTLSRVLHVRIEESFIKKFERLNHDKENETSPRTLVVHLINQNIKKRILTVAGSITLRKLDSNLPITINEHLTYQNQQLLKKARQEALKHNINKVWVENCKIFVRRNDDAPIHEIKSDKDINDMSKY